VPQVKRGGDVLRGKAAFYRELWKR